MKRFNLIMILVAVNFLAIDAFAQRYLCEVFDDVTVTNDIVYGENYSVLTGAPILYNLTMDVYEPAGDTVPERPLIIMTHPGSFLPKGVNTLPFGARDDLHIVEICEQFAKRGWVAASISYRLGWNPTLPTQEERASSIINAVYRAMGDCKTAARYFRKDAAATNAYGIDASKIVIGGSNSGGYLAIASVTLNDTAELVLPKFVDSLGNSFINQALWGDFEGLNGTTGFNIDNHTGFSSDFQMALNLGGAIGDTMWSNPGEAPIVSLHGELDPLTPYGTAVVLVSSGTIPIVEVSGSHDLSMVQQANGNVDDWIAANFSDDYTAVAESRTNFEGLLGFPGAANGYEPWAWYDCNDPNAQAPPTGNPADGCGSAANPYAYEAKALLYIDSIMNYFAPRAVETLGLTPTGSCYTGITDEVRDASFISIQPNPATTQIQIKLANFNESFKMIDLYDITGKLLISQKASGQEFTLNRNDIAAGSYFLTVTLTDDSRINKQVIFE